MNHIAILTHEHDDFDETPYVMRWVAQACRDQGMRVSIVRGPQEFIEADLAVQHVDLTVVSDEYMQFMQQFPLTINATVRDISKRRISSNVVRQGDGYDGPVIIKTNRNYGGAREAEIARRTSRLQRYTSALRRQLPWSWGAEMGVWDYPIYDRASRVPRAVWLNPDLIVDKFLPERQGEFYCMRCWLFLGDVERNTIMYANQPIIKSKVAVREEPAEVPDELRQMRCDLGFDYGKFDYAVVDGRTVLYDANKTPCMGAGADQTLVDEMADAAIRLCQTGPQLRAA